MAKIEHPITSQVRGSFGTLRAEDATALAMVLSELVQNAVEHGLAETGGGTVDVEAQRSTDDRGDELLTVTITDDGAGLPGDFRPGGSGLGTQIVQSLVQDLRGPDHLGSSKAARYAGAFHRAASATGEGHPPEAVPLSSVSCGACAGRCRPGRRGVGSVSRRGGRGRCDA